MPAAQKVIESVHQDLTSMAARSCFPSQAPLETAPTDIQETHGRMSSFRYFLQCKLPRFLVPSQISNIMVLQNFSPTIHALLRRHSSSTPEPLQPVEEARCALKPAGNSNVSGGRMLQVPEELLHAMLEAIDGGRELQEAKNTYGLGHNQHSQWLTELWAEKARLRGDYEVLATRAVKQPRKELFKAMAQIQDRIFVIDQADYDVHENHESIKPPMKEAESRQAERCERLVALLDEALTEPESQEVREVPPVEQLEAPFDTTLLETHRNLVDSSEGICQLQEPSVETLQEEVHGWSSLLGPREEIHEEVLRALEVYEEESKGLVDFQEYERELCKDQWLQVRDEGKVLLEETESEYEAKMDTMEVNLQMHVRCKEAELDVSRRRAAFCGLRLDEQGNELDDDSDVGDESEFDWSEDSKNAAKVKRWANSIEESDDEKHDFPPLDGWNTRQVDAAEQPEVDDWPWREMELDESLSQYDEQDDYQQMLSPTCKDDHQVISDEPMDGYDDSESGHHHVHQSPHGGMFGSEGEEDDEAEPECHIVEAEEGAQTSGNAFNEDEEASGDDADEDLYLTSDNAFVRGLQDRQQAKLRRMSGQRRLRARLQ